MSSYEPAAPGALPTVRRQPTTPYSAKVAREIVLRTMAGETQAQICADAHMPCLATLWRWAKKHPDFADIYSRARALGERDGPEARRGYCPVTAHEIAARVSEGESLAAVSRDPAMPSLRTIFRWATREAAFAEALAIARMAQAERFADVGWSLAMEATPETAFLTQVRLKQLRWTCAVMSPGTHGRLKAVDPQLLAPQPPEPPAPERPPWSTVLLRSFRVERHPDPTVRKHRVVGFTPNPDTMIPERDSEGPWSDIPDGAA